MCSSDLLCIVGTERHESRRIDNQLRGRAGRQGDPGSTQFFISLEDELMRLFGGDRMQTIVNRMGLAEDEAIEAGMLTRSIESAQKKVEGRNFGIRKYVLQYDNVMNKQREIIYDERRKVLFGEDLRDYVMKMMEDLVSNTGFRVQHRENGGEFKLTARRDGAAASAGSAAVADSAPRPQGKARLAVLVAGKTLGREDKELGEVLIKGFLGTLSKLETPPAVSHEEHRLRFSKCRRPTGRRRRDS